MLLPLLFGFLAKLRMFVNSKFCTFIYLYLHKRMRRRQSKSRSRPLRQSQAKPGSQSRGGTRRAGVQRRQLGVSTRMFEWLPTTNNKQISSHGNAAVDVDVDAEEQRPNKQAARTTLTTFT